MTKPRRRHLTVIDRNGQQQRFLRGMVTHDLMQRGLDFDRAYAVAHAIRDHFADRDEVTTAEIKDSIDELVDKLCGPEIAGGLLVARRPEETLRILARGEAQPFSRGLLARSLLAAGLEFDRAYRLAIDLESDLRDDGQKMLSSDELARRVGELLERREGIERARRYWLVRRLHRLPRPIVIYLGGASGTGKSTLALELAPLLRIYRINSTDTIRQMMRMVFSPKILPMLHVSSFEATQTGGDLSEALADDESLAAGFEEQATRVVVGVRAVVERAIAENMSLLVEGIHLYPPLVPFTDLEGSAYQVPLFLMTSDAETHRGRFLSRARLGGRRAERYLENFSSIRKIHTALIQQAEAYDVALIDTSEGDTVPQALSLVTGLLQKKLPRRGRLSWSEPQALVPTLLIVIDGLGDRSVRSLGGRTPLQAAATPNLDRLARAGQCGLADPVSPGVVPDTAAGSLALFGQLPGAMQRGPVEALGAGIDLKPGDIALRGNFATLDAAGVITHRRAGRIRETSAELAAALDDLPLPGTLRHEIEVRVRPATEHRLAVVFRGDGLSSAILGSDPGDGAIPGRPLLPRAEDPQNAAAVYTARALELFEQQARRLLAAHPVNRQRLKRALPPANTVLSRGAGRVHRLLPLTHAGTPLRVSCIGGDRTVLGLARWLDAEALSRPEMTANLDTDLRAKFTAAEEALEHRHLVMLHIKGADIAAHDKRPDLKKDFLEKVDRELGSFLDRRSDKPLRVAVTGDHATLSESGQHAADPLPVLISGAGFEADDIEIFDEQAVALGSLHRFPLQMLLGRLFDLD